MNKYFRSLYGSTASIKKHENKFRLRIRDQYGNLYHNKAYTSYRGARIALGRTGDDWKDVTIE